MKNPTESPPGILKDAELASRRFRLPFSRRAWQGTQGSWSGLGTGNSIDFQDHRSYQWGDDPRGIHWAAYARTGQLTMKVYQAELSPRTDIVVDVSESMFITPERANATMGLTQFCLLSAARAGARPRIHAVKGGRILPIEKADVMTGVWPAAIRELPVDEGMPDNIPWNHNGMKVFISDLLYPGEPAALLDHMATRGGMSIVLAPTLPEEAHAPEVGNARLKNCESGLTRTQYVSESLARRYARAYAAHFELWANACRQRRIAFACIPCHLPLAEALSADAYRSGAVEFI